LYYCIFNANNSILKHTQSTEIKEFLILFLLLFACPKSNKKRAPPSNTARWRMVPWLNFCTTVASAVVILFLGAESSIYFPVE